MKVKKVVKYLNTVKLKKRGLHKSFLLVKITLISAFYSLLDLFRRVQIFYAKAISLDLIHVSGIPAILFILKAKRIRRTSFIRAHKKKVKQLLWMIT